MSTINWNQHVPSASDWQGWLIYCAMPIIFMVIGIQTRGVGRIILLAVAVALAICVIAGLLYRKLWRGPQMEPHRLRIRICHAGEESLINGESAQNNVVRLSKFKRDPRIPEYLGQWKPLPRHPRFR